MNCLTKLFQQKRRRIGYILAFSDPMISKRDSSDTQSEIYGWFIEYGIAANGQFIMFDTEGNTYTKSTVGSWHKTVITLKAIKGEHEKSIKLYTTSEKKTDQSIILFNGRSFKDDTGYYQNGKWYQGKPNGVIE